MLSRSKGPLGSRNGGYAKILPVEDAKVSLGETASKARDTTRGAAQGRPSDLFHRVPTLRAISKEGTAWGVQVLTIRGKPGAALVFSTQRV